MGLFDIFKKDEKKSNPFGAGGGATGKQKGATDVNPVRWEADLVKMLKAEHQEILALTATALECARGKRFDEAVTMVKALTNLLEKHSAREETKLYQFMKFEARFDGDIAASLKECGASHVRGIEAVQSFCTKFRPRMGGELSESQKEEMEEALLEFQDMFSQRVALEESSLLPCYPLAPPA